MSDTVDPDELNMLAALPMGTLYETLGEDLENSAIECLNQALANHGGEPIVVDGEAHNMSDYIGPDKLKNVLIDARRLAEARRITLSRTTALESVQTDDDALRFVMGG